MLGSVEIKIGIADIAHEVVIDVDSTVDDTISSFSDAMKKDDGLLRLADAKGRHLVIPAARIAYLDLGSAEHHPVGFGAPEQ